MSATSLRGEAPEGGPAAVGCVVGQRYCAAHNSAVVVLEFPPLAGHRCYAARVLVV